MVLYSRSDKRPFLALTRDTRPKDRCSSASRCTADSVGGCEDNLLLVVEDVLRGYSRYTVLDRLVASLDLLRLLVPASVLPKAGRHPPETRGRLQDLFRFLDCSGCLRGSSIWGFCLAPLLEGLGGRQGSRVSNPMTSCQSLLSADSRAE